MIGKRRASYPIIVFAGVLVKLMESHLCVQLVGVRLRNRKDNLKIKEKMQVNYKCKELKEQSRVSGTSCIEVPKKKKILKETSYYY